MLQFLIQHVFTEVRGSTRAFREAFKVPVYEKAFRWKMPYDEPEVKEWVYFYEDDRILTGLVNLARIRAESQELPWTEVDQRRWPKIPKEVDLGAIISRVGFEHRPYQYSAVERLVKCKRGIWAACTAAGKTTMLALAIHRLQLPTLVLTPPARKDIAVDSTTFFKETFGLPARFCNRKLEDGDLVVSGASLLFSRLKRDPKGTKRWLSRFQLLALDECHELSDGLHRLLPLVPAPYRVFMTGTPNPQDEVRATRMMAHSGPIMLRATTEEMVAQGYVAQPFVAQVRYWHEYGFRPGTEYGEVYEEAVVLNQDRNDFVAKVTHILRAQGHSVLVTVPWKRHCYLLGSTIKESVVYTGDQSTELRQDIRQAMRVGDVKVVVGNNPAEVGISIPAISAIVVAGGGKAPCQVIQRVGRGMRLKDSGDDRLLVVDIADEIGMNVPTGFRSLKGISQQVDKRKNLYLAEGMKVLPLCTTLSELIAVGEKFRRTDA